MESPITTRGRGLFYIYDPSASTKFVFGYLTFKSTEIWNPNRFSDFAELITMRGRGLFYISDPSASTKTYLIELEFCLSLLLLPS